MELQETGLIPLPCTLHCSKGELHFLELILLGCACKENSSDKRVLEGESSPWEQHQDRQRFHHTNSIPVQMWRLLASPQPSLSVLRAVINK